MEKRIPGHEDYAVTEDGQVISYKYKTPRVMKQWRNRGGYCYVSLCKNNIAKHYGIHQLVAQTLIPNPEGYKEINHKDNDTTNNHVNNLEWCSRRHNVHQEYNRCGPVRNHVDCVLIRISTGEIIEKFESILAAARYSNEHFGTSISSIVKYRKSQDYKVERCND